jgi:formyltetrahydrofolate deformylase
MSPKNSAILLTKCPEQKGIVAAVADFIYKHNGNILHADDHQDPELQMFMMRVEWDLEGFDFDLEEFGARFAPVAQKFKMEWQAAHANHRPRVAILVSKSGHCLADLLYRHHIGELACEIPLILSNHEDTRRLAEFYHIPFHAIPHAKDDRAQTENAALKLLQKAKVELIVLARYMQILSQEFVSHYPHRIINIHHSFLPAFTGAKPYHRSYERGVKLVGATSHYVTETLDDGPIIEQDFIRVSHRDQLEDLVRKGGDVERIVLSRAVRWHLENRVLVYGNKTVVFD